jgi:hypothetical protein
MEDVRMTKKIVGDRKQVLRTYSGPLTRDEFVKMLDKELKTLPPKQRETAKFEMDKFYERYDPDEYVALFMVWDRPETDEEEKTRERNERDRAKIRELSEREEFKRLSKKFGEKK